MIISAVHTYKLILAQNYLKQEYIIIYFSLEMVNNIQYVREMYALVS